MGGAAGVWGKEVTTQGHPISVCPKRELYSGSQQQVQLIFGEGCALSPILFLIIMDRISRRSRGGVVLQFGELRISSLLFADDGVWMASSVCDLSTH